MAKDRIDFLDQLKGYGILLVVMGHLIGVFLNPTDMNNNQLFRFIYSFHMPLFMFVSGYIAGKLVKISSLRMLFSFVGNKAKQLLIPMLIWPVIMYGCTFFHNNVSLTGVYQSFLYELSYPSLWFLHHLFIFMFSYAIFSFVVSKFRNNLKWDIALILLSIATVTLMDKSFSILCAIFYLGVLVGRNKIIEQIMKKGQILFACFWIYILLIYYWDRRLQDMMHLGLRIVLPLAAIVLLWNISQHVEKITPPNNNCKDVSIFGKLHIVYLNRIHFYGKNSLVIYIIHYIIIANIGRWNLTCIGNDNFFLFLTICLILGIVISEISVLIANIVRVIPLGHFILGEKNNKC